jgi:hypothetical protein
MPKLTEFEQLLDAIEGEILGKAEARISSLELAREFRKSHRDLIRPFIDEWVDGKLALLFARRRKELIRSADQQLMFEYFLGFKHLPKKIQYKGKSVLKADATVGVFERLLVDVRKREAPIEAEVTEAVALMKKYTPSEPLITWAEVLEREASKKGGRVA